MRVLDLFVGLGGFSQAFKDQGHDVRTLDHLESFRPTYRVDICDWDPVGEYDVILASPPCTQFSVMQIARHWDGIVPRTEEAQRAVEIVEHTVRVIETLKPQFFVFENPIGKLRKLHPLQRYERRSVTYCQYGEDRMKPTDLWGGFPPSLKLRTPCRNGDSCHKSSPRGSHDAGVQSRTDDGFKHMPRMSRDRSTKDYQTYNAAVRAMVPYELSEELCVAMEGDL